MAETDIILKVGLDDSDLMKQTREVRGKVKNALDSGSDSKFLQGYENKLDKLITKLDTLQRKQTQAATASNANLEKSKQIASDLLWWYKRQEEIQQKIEKFRGSLSDDDKALKDSELLKKYPRTFGEITKSAQTAQHIVEQLEADLQRAQDKYARGVDRYLDVTGRVAQAERDIVNLNAGAEMSIGNFEEQQLVEQEEANAERVATAWERVTGVFSGVRNAVGNLARGFAQLAVRVMQSVKAHIQQSKASRGMNFDFKKLTSVLLKYGLGVRSLYFAFRRLRTATVAAFKQLASEYDPVNQQLSELSGGLAQLKNSLATAFQPILSVVAPILNSLIEMLNSAAAAIANFIATLTGQTVIYKATKVTKDLAKELKGAGGAADKAKKAFADFDEIHVIDLSQSGGGGGGASSEKQFEQVEAGGIGADFAEKFKEAWEKADFTEIGNIIGLKLKSALDEASEFLVKVAQPFAQRLGTSIGTFLNGFFETEGLGFSLGTTIGETINTALAFANSLLDSTHFDSIGRFIGDGIMGAVESINWEEIGHFYAQKANAIFDVLKGIAESYDAKEVADSIARSINTAISDFNWAANAKSLSEFAIDLVTTLSELIKGVDWAQLGRNIAEFVISIDWTGVADAVFDGLGAALGGLGAFLQGLVEEAWNKLITWWHDTAYEDGQFTMEGLLDGIWQVMVNIGTWIHDHIFKPFIDGFKTAFGIASPSKEMEKLGKFLMEGLLKGINSLVDNVRQIWENIKAKTKEIWENIQTTVVGIVEDVKTKVTDRFGLLKESIILMWETVKNSVVGAWENMWAGIKNTINLIIGGVERFANSVVDGINRVIDALNELLSVDIDIPEWVPEIGGQSFDFGIDIPKLDHIALPRLAQGAVLPPNQPFMAMLGDQKQGTNIEAPLDTIKQALMEVMAESDTDRNITINFTGNLAALARIMKPELDRESVRRGGSLIVRGGVL